MRKALLCWLGLASFVSGAQAPVARPSFDAFDVATIKMPTDDEKGRFIQMQGTNRFVARDYTLKLLIAAAYELNPKTITGGYARRDRCDGGQCGAKAFRELNRRHKDCV